MAKCTIIVCPNPGIQHHTAKRDNGYGLVYHAICLFIPPAFCGYSFQPATEGGLRLSRPGYLGSAPRWFTRPQTVTHISTNRA